MNVVDSSGWLEYMAVGPNGEFFRPAVEETGSLVVPTISIYEVFRRAAAQRGEERALEVCASMRRGLVVDLDPDLAVDSARLGAEHRLPMADAIILATARRYGATLWTQDTDFKGMPGVRFVAPKPR